MKWLTTLRARLLATYLGLIVLGFGGLTLLAGWQIANSAYTDFANTLQRNATLLASNLSGPLHEAEEYGYTAQPIMDLVRRTADGLNARVLLMDHTGRPFLDSNTPTMTSQRESGFVSERILNDGTGYIFATDEMGNGQIVVTTPLQDEDRPIGYLQLAAPIAQPRSMVRQRWIALAVGFLLFAIVGTVVSLWLLSTLIKPLRRLRATALQLAAGDLTQRVPQPGIDEIGAVGTAFNQMAERVEAMVAEQRAFAGNASHELRTPLTTLRLRTEALLQDELDAPTKQQYITEIDHAVTHMNGLVDDLILLSRLDARRLAVGEEQVDVGRVIRSVQQELAPFIDHKTLSVTVEQPSPSLPPVQANLNHLRVVIRNLLENGVKYTPPNGAIVITLATDASLLRCQIRDTGLGIAAAELPHVHKRFHRAALARQRQTQLVDGEQADWHDGSGLGLALVDSVVALYGGRLEITSAGLDQGTTATIWWPFEQKVM